jgi:penicillin-binding protein 1A
VLLVALLALGSTACDGLYRYDVSLDQQAVENAESTIILDHEGNPLTTLLAEQNRTEVPLEKMGYAPACKAAVKPTDGTCANLVDAVVAIEDERFWEHRGVDLKAQLRALVRNVDSGEVIQGASTITQQWVKNAFLSPEQTAGRKAKEIVTALQVEKKYKKEKILENYLNTIYFGNGQYGVQAAARYYFNTDADQLTLAQAAMIAGLPKAPEQLNPYTQPDDTRTRRDEVLDAMLKQGYITQAQFDEARAIPIGVPQDPPVSIYGVTLPMPPGQLYLHKATAYPAPHFIDAVKRFILYDDSFGAALRAKGLDDSKEGREKLLFQSGLRITTTLDQHLQDLAEQAVKGIFPDPADQWPTAALVSLDPKTGEVKAMVGGRGDYFDPDDPKGKFDFASVGRRQTGSSFKPFVLAAALQAGKTLNFRVDSTSPAHIELPNGQVWEPRNAEGTGHGLVDLVTATRESINAAYANLIVDIGPEAGVDMAKKLGVKSPLQPYYSAVLGSNEVTPLDMASAYSTLADRGIYNTPAFVTRVTRANGDVIYERTADNKQVIDTDLADTVSSVLTQVVCCGTAAQNGPLPEDRPAAGKTGSTDDNKDAWFVGYTSCAGDAPCLATAVWVGFADRPRPMKPPATPITVFGGTYPTRMWHDYMAAALEGQPMNDFPPAAPQYERPEPSSGGGTALRELPAVTGLTYEQAVAALNAAGFNSVTRLDRASTAAPGTVVDTTPSGSASPSATITVYVATPPGGTVPSVLGQSAADAQAALQGAGFVVRVETQQRDGAPATEAGKVWRTNPDPGAPALRGATIVIYVNPAAGGTATTGPTATTAPPDTSATTAPPATDPTATTAPVATSPPAPLSRPTSAPAAPAGTPNPTTPAVTPST